MDSQFTPPMSAAYREAVGKFAERICVDPAHLLQSHPIDYEGVRFRFDHHGHIDPQGLLVVVEVGTVEPGSEAVVLRHLLERHVLTPAAVCGYYGMVPGTQVILYFVRLDLSAQADCADAIAALITSVTYGLKELMDELKRDIDQALNPAAAHPSTVNV